MLNSLGARAIVPVGLSVTGFVVVCSILLYSGMKADMVRNTIQHETNLADTIVQSARYAMLKDDREALRNIVRNIGAHEGVEHVRIFNKKGLIMFSSLPEEVHRFVDKQAAGCSGCHAGPVASTTLGAMQKARRFVNERERPVLAITAPIYNEPDCTTAACHFHRKEQKLLGTLDIGLSEAPLREALASLRSRMALFSCMVLVLTVGGVLALLRRTVLLPIEQLTEFTRTVSLGEERPLPPVRGQVGELAAWFQRTAAELRAAKTEIARLREGAEPSGEEPPPPSTSSGGRGA
jgi:hypothetical protein